MIIIWRETTKLSVALTAGCARTCPKGAIIFPKCPDAKISGKEEDNKEEDFYDLLKQRRRRKVLK